MATYRTINASEVLAGQGITESLMTALANNLEGVLDGDPTARRIEPRLAMDQNSGSVTGEVLRTGNILFPNGTTAYLTVSLNNPFPVPIVCDVYESITGSENGATFSSDFYTTGGTLIPKEEGRFVAPVGDFEYRFNVTKSGAATPTITRAYAAVKGHWL